MDQISSKNQISSKKYISINRFIFYSSKMKNLGLEIGKNSNFMEAKYKLI